MSRARRISSLVFLSALALLLWDCGARRGAEPTYFLVSANIRVPYWQTAGLGFMRAASQLQVSAEFVGPDSYDPRAEQQEFQRVVKLKPAGILISAADPDLMKPDIDAAITAGIPVITMDSDSPSSKRLLFIGTNNYQAGMMGGQITAQILGGKGNVVLFTMPGQANLDERFRGYSELFSGYKQIQVVRVVDIKGNPRIAFEKATEIVEKEKDKVNGFVCLEALACNEVAKVLSSRDIRNKTVVAMDTDPGTLVWIQKGVISATIAQKPFTMGYVGLKMLDELYHHKLGPLVKDWAKDPFAPIPRFVDTGVTLLDGRNVGAFLQTQESGLEKR